MNMNMTDSLANRVRSNHNESIVLGSRVDKLTEAIKQIAAEHLAIAGIGLAYYHAREIVSGTHDLAALEIAS